MKQTKLSIREILEKDIPSLLRYWKEVTEEDLDRMGELARPEEKANQDFLLWFTRNRPSLGEAKEDILIWEVDGEAIGYSTLKDVRPAIDGQMHLHLWKENLRGRGYGAVLFCLSVLEFKRKHGLLELYCQPKSDNPHPNRMLKRIGFEIMGPWQHKHSTGQTVSQTRYRLSDRKAKDYLASQRDRFLFLGGV